MKVLPINRYRFYQTLQPLFLLKRITSKFTTGCLQVFTDSDSWSIYVQEGKLVYACCADKMFELLYKHLQNFSQRISTLPHGIQEQLRAIFETGIDNQAIQNPDYLAICWLVNQKYITSTEAGILIEKIALEVLDKFLHLKKGSYEFISQSFLDEMPKFCHLDIRLLVASCQKRSQAGMEGKLFGRGTPHLQLSSLGRSPNLKQHLQVLHSARSQSGLANIPIPNAEGKIYKIFCIDDSSMVINAIKNFLDSQMFSFVGISETLQALMHIICVKPDIILLDVDMPVLDGYELCSLLRNHSNFQNTPIILMTGGKSFLDKFRAKLVKASGFLSKPFTQADLLKIIFQYLN